MKNTELLNASIGLTKQADLNQILQYLQDKGSGALSALGEGYNQYISPYVTKGLDMADPYIQKAQELLNNYRPLNAEDSWKGGLAAAGVGGLLGLLRNKFRNDDEESDNRMSDIMTYAALMGLPVAAAPLISSRLGKFMGDRTAKDLLYGQGGINEALRNPNFNLSDKQYQASEFSNPGAYTAARNAPSVNSKGLFDSIFPRGSSTANRGVGASRADVESAHASGDLANKYTKDVQGAGVMDLLHMITNIPKDTSADVDYTASLQRDMQADPVE